MAQEITISGLVPEKELKDMQSLLNIFKETSKEYADLAIQLSGGIKVKAGSLDELKLKAEQSTTIMKQLADTQNQLSKLQKDYQVVVAKLTEATKQRTASIVEQAKANDLNSAAELKAQKAETERLKQQKLLNQESKNSKVSMEEVIKLLDYEANSYYETNKAVLTLERGLKEMDAVDVNGAIGQKTIAKIQALKENLTSLDAKMGNYQRNVGNYSSAWNGLQYQMQMISREMPNFFIDFRTGIISLTNNLPYLQDELVKANKAYKDYIAAVKAGNTDIQKVQPVWKQLISSIFSWQTALIVVISLVTMYSKEIKDWVGGLFNAKDAINQLYDAETKLSISRKQGIEDSVQESTKLRVLYGATQDATRSVRDRKAAADELQKLYPDYFANMKDEQILAGEAADSYRLLSQEIVASAIARAQLNEMDKIASQRFGLWVKERNAYVSLLRSEMALEQNNSELQQAITENNRKKWQEAKNNLDNIDETLKGMGQSIDVSALTKDLSKDTAKELEKENKKKEKEQEKYAQYMKRIDAAIASAHATAIEQERENEIADVEAKYKQREAKIKGNSEKEIELRKAYAIAMGKEISDINEKYDTQTEQANLERRLDGIRSDTSEELEQRLQIQLSANEILRQSEVREAERRGEDVEAVNKKYDARFIGIIQSNAAEQLGLIEKNADREAQFTDAINQEKINELDKNYRSGLISEKEYRNSLYKLTKESGEARLKVLLAEAETELKLYENSLPQDKVEELRARIKSLKAQIDAFENGLSDDENNPTKRWADGFSDALKNMQSVASDELGDTANIFNAFTGILDKFAEYAKKTGKDVNEISFEDFWNSLSGEDKVELALTAFAQIYDGITNLMSDMLDSQIDAIEDEQDANQDAYDDEVDRIEELEDNGAISSEEAEARKRAAKDKTAAKDAELEKKKEELELKQAKYNKANSIVQATIATALGVSKALPNLVLAAIVGVMGAAEIATILATPLAAYAKGTDDHKGGLAVVGDGGRKEVILTPKGEAYLTPSTPTLVDIPMHSQVIPNAEDYYKNIRLRSDLGLMMRQSELDNEPIMINVNNDFSRLEKEMRGLRESNDNMMKYFKKMTVNNELNALKNKFRS